MSTQSTPGTGVLQFPSKMLVQKAILFERAIEWWVMLNCGERKLYAFKQKHTPTPLTGKKHISFKRLQAEWKQIGFASKRPLCVMGTLLGSN